MSMQKMVHTREFIIDSEDYDNKTDNVLIKLPMTINNVTAITINYVKICNSIFNITTSNQNIYTSSGTKYTIPIGPYTASSLISKLQSLLGFTITITDAGIITISSSSPFSLLFGSYKDNPAKLLGFEEKDYINSTSYTGTYICKVWPGGLYYIGSNLLSSYLDRMTIIHNTESKVIMKVDVDNLYGTYIKLDTDATKRIQFRQVVPLTSFDLTLYDRKMNVLDLHGGDWIIGLDIETND